MTDITTVGQRYHGTCSTLTAQQISYPTTSSSSASPPFTTSSSIHHHNPPPCMPSSAPFSNTPPSPDDEREVNRRVMAILRRVAAQQEKEKNAAPPIIRPIRPGLKRDKIAVPRQPIQPISAVKLPKMETNYLVQEKAATYKPPPNLTLSNLLLTDSDGILRKQPETHCESMKTVIPTNNTNHHERGTIAIQGAFISPIVQEQASQTIVPSGVRFILPSPRSKLSTVPIPTATSTPPPPTTTTDPVRNSNTNNSTSSWRRCSCSRSCCLKLYCECFAAGVFCSDCSCLSCYNLAEHGDRRQQAIMQIVNRKPDAFQSKIALSTQSSAVHTRGCNCRRSGCLKNYCECYEARIPCSSRCRCQYCANTSDKHNAAAGERHGSKCDDIGGAEDGYLDTSTTEESCSPLSLPPSVPNVMLTTTVPETLASTPTDQPFQKPPITASLQTTTDIKTCTPSCLPAPLINAPDITIAPLGHNPAWKENSTLIEAPVSPAPSTSLISLDPASLSLPIITTNLLAAWLSLLSTPAAQPQVTVTTPLSMQNDLILKLLNPITPTLSTSTVPMSVVSTETTAVSSPQTSSKTVKHSVTPSGTSTMTNATASEQYTEEELQTFQRILEQRKTQADVVRNVTTELKETDKAASTQVTSFIKVEPEDEPSQRPNCKRLKENKRSLRSDVNHLFRQVRHLTRTVRRQNAAIRRMKRLLSREGDKLSSNHDPS